MKYFIVFQDLLIQVKAASVNPLDVLMSSGYGYSLFELMQSRSVENFSTFRPFPIVLGRDFSGVVVDKGMDTQDFQIGDQVGQYCNKAGFMTVANSFNYFKPSARKTKSLLKATKSN